MTATIDRATSGPCRSGASVPLRLRAHVQRRGRTWIADIDDESNRQPDDPYWFSGDCASAVEAIAKACATLATMASDPGQVQCIARLSGWVDPDESAAHRWNR